MTTKEQLRKPKNKEFHIINLNIYGLFFNIIVFPSILLILSKGQHNPLPVLTLLSRYSRATVLRWIFTSLTKALNSLPSSPHLNTISWPFNRLSVSSKSFNYITTTDDQ